MKSVAENSKYKEKTKRNVVKKLKNVERKKKQPLRKGENVNKLNNLKLGLKFVLLEEEEVVMEAWKHS